MNICRSSLGRALPLIWLLAAGSCSAPASSGLLPPVEQSDSATGLAAKPATGQARGKLPHQLRRALGKLGQERGACDVFDYFPRGGMRVFYCYLRPLLDYRTVQKLSGVKVFLSGPHSAHGLDLKSSDFGRYNPAFVQWLNRMAVAVASRPELVRSTRPVYHKNVRFLALQLSGTYLKLRRHPRYLQREVRGHKWSADYERYFFFMNPHFVTGPRRPDRYYWSHGGDGEGYDGNVVKTCVAFWLRRTVDGTAARFYSALNTLQCAYDRKAVLAQGGRCS